MSLKILSALGALFLLLFMVYFGRKTLFVSAPASNIVHTLRYEYAYAQEKSNYVAVLGMVEKLVASKNVTPESLREALQKMHDAHLEFRALHMKFVSSNLELALNNERVLELKGKRAVLPRNFIVAIDGVPVDQWIDKYEMMVSYSSEWARNYRTLGLLRSFPVLGAQLPRPTTVTIRNERDSHTLPLEWSESPKNELCVSSQNINNAFVLKIATFWCESRGASRERVLEAFKSEFKQALSEYRPGQRVIIDLRGNRGGGDEEVRHALAPFLSGRVLLYRFQYSGESETRQDYLTFEEGKLSKEKLTLLVDSGCGSSCEVFVSVLSHNALAETIGFQTHGCAGDPKSETFGEWVFTYPRAKVWHESGHLYEGHGLVPNIRTGPSELRYHEGDLLSYTLNLLSQRDGQNKN